MKTTPRPFGREGFSLVEVMIASVILLFIVIVALVVMLNASSAAAKASLSGDLEARGRSVVERCRAQLSTARFRNGTNDTLGLYLNNTIIWYQLPVSVNKNGAPDWGYSPDIGFNDPASDGKSCLLRFEAETCLQESSAAPVASQPAAGPVPSLPALPDLEYPSPRNIDINRDHDLLDTFVRGKIMQYILKSDLTVETEAVFADNVMLAVVNGTEFNGDFDGLSTTAAEQDQLFRWVDKAGDTFVSVWPETSNDLGGRAIVISVWHGTYSDDGKMYYTRRCSETVRLKNPQ